MQQTYVKQTTLLDVALRREFAGILARLHKTDFSKPVDPINMSSGGGSAYMQDLTDKLAFVKGEILGRMSMGEFMRDWYVSHPSPPVHSDASGRSSCRASSFALSCCTRRSRARSPSRAS